MKITYIAPDLSHGNAVIAGKPTTFTVDEVTVSDTSLRARVGYKGKEVWGYGLTVAEALAHAEEWILSQYD